MLGFYRNDFEDNLKAGLFDLNKESNLVLIKTSHIPGVKIQNVIYSIPGVRWLGENSYFYSALFNATWEYFKKQRRKRVRAQLDVTTEYAMPEKSVYSDYELALATAILERMHKFSTQTRPSKCRGTWLAHRDRPEKSESGISGFVA